MAKPTDCPLCGAAGTPKMTDRVYRDGEKSVTMALRVHSCSMSCKGENYTWTLLEDLSRATTKAGKEWKAKYGEAMPNRFSR